MVIEMSKYLTPENASLGLKQVISDVNSGDTILFDIKAEYHFYKDFSEHKVCHMTNTDSFKNPDKYFAFMIENKENITIDGNGSTLVVHGAMCAFALFNCKNIVFKNLRITYNSPTNYELTVISKIVIK